MADESAATVEQTALPGLAAPTEVEAAVRAYLDARLATIVQAQYPEELARFRALVAEARDLHRTVTTAFERTSVELTGRIAALQADLAKSVDQALASLEETAIECRGRTEAAGTAIDAAIADFSERGVADLKSALAAAQEAALRNLEASVAAELERSTSSIRAANEAVAATSEANETLKARVEQLRTDAEASWTKALDAAVAALNEKVDGALAAQKAAITELQSKAQAQVAAAADEFKTEAKLRAEAHEAALGQSKADFAAVIADYKDKVEQSFAATATRFSALTGSTEQTVSDAIAKHQSALQVQEGDGAALLARLKALEAEVKDTAGVTGMVALSGHNRKRAAEAAKEAAVWRSFAIRSALLGAAAVCTLFFQYWWSVAGDPELGAIGMRLGISLPIWVLFTYCAATASDFQKSAEYNERIANELASMEPYLAPMPDAEKHQIKSRLADRFFGAGNAQAAKDDRPGHLDALKSGAEGVKAALAPVADLIDKVRK